MTDINHNSSTGNEEHDIGENCGINNGRSSKVRKALIWLVFIICTMGALIYGGYAGQGVSMVINSFPYLKESKLIKDAGRFFSPNRKTLRMAPVFKRSYPDDLFTEQALLAIIGQSPSEPSRVLFKTFSQAVEKDPGTDKELNPDLGAAGETESERSRTVSETPEITGIDQSQPVIETLPERDGPRNVDDLATLLAKTAPKPVETRVIKSDKPAKETDIENGKKDDEAAIGDASTREMSEHRESQDQGKSSPNGQEKVVASVNNSDSNDTDSQETDIPSTARAVNGRVDNRASLGKQDGGNITENPEKFKVPGSLKVSITGYSGASAKWALMVILDDSAAMGRVMKPWRPNRMKSATDFIELMAKKAPKGTKIAVRDFYCSSGKRRRNRTSPLCLSHMLYEWAVYPYDSLKSNLENVNPIGRTNPCAAAAFTLKRDFRNLGDLHPRVAIITSGMTRCRINEVLRIINTRWAAKKPYVDVIGLGLSRRAARNYSTLAKKTNGAILSIDTPDETKEAVIKYEESLDKRVTGKIEVKGPGSGFKVKPDEEITLAPGSYAVILPEVKGLNESERTIASVKVRSGKTSKVMVRLRKGKMSYKTAIN